jgi:aminoglycoside phosphotransferase (APT) family kinase protein
MASFEEARARRALEGAGLDYTMPLERASSVTNEVWVAERYVVRVNRRPDQRLRREADLGPLLPAEVGYPEIVAYGGQLGADWLVCERVPGLVLSRCWPAMTPSERREAVRQFAVKLEALHGFHCPPDLPEVETPQLLGGPRTFNPIDPLLSAIEEAKLLEHVDTGVLKAAERIVRDTAYTLDPWAVDTLVHGDLHFENVLWDGQRITTLLDFEWARSGPPDLDLDVFLRFCAYPFLHVAEDYEHLTLADDYADVPFWLAQAYPELFDHPHQFERVRIYCIAYDVRELLLFPPQRRPRELSEHHPYNRLVKTVYGFSHLDRLNSERAERHAG